MPTYAVNNYHELRISKLLVDPRGRVIEKILSRVSVLRGRFCAVRARADAGHLFWFEVPIVLAIQAVQESTAALTTRDFRI